MPNSNPSEFDWSQAESLLGEDPNGVPEDMAELVLELVQGSEQRYQELKNFNPETEKTGISSLAHQLRGSLLNFGFVEAAGKLLQIEKRDYQIADYPGLVEASEAAFVSSTKLLGERYPCLKLA